MFFPRRLVVALALGPLLWSSGCVRAADWVLRHRDSAVSPGADGLVATDSANPDGSSGDGGSGDVGSADGRSGDLGMVRDGLGGAGTAPAATFSMGSPATESCREPWASKETLHAVTLSADLAVGTHEVTQAEFVSLIGYNPSHFGGCGDCPVENLSWHEAAAYCNVLSQREGRPSCYSCSGSDRAIRCTPAQDVIAACTGYRLPTEAEWEHAARAGSTTATYEGTIANCKADPVADLIGWYGSQAQRPRPVGGKRPNAWGLYDMAGNVWEWCHDWHGIDLGGGAVTDPSGEHTGSHRVVRGGSWTDDAGKLRAAMRDSSRPDTTRPYIGFRWVRRLP